MMKPTKEYSFSFEPQTCSIRPVFSPYIEHMMCLNGFTERVMSVLDIC